MYMKNVTQKQNKRNQRRSVKSPYYGGISLKKLPEAALSQFIDNETCQIFEFSSGANGFIFSASIKNKNESPYNDIRSKYYNRPVRNILIKLVATAPSLSRNPKRNKILFEDKRNKAIETESNFRNEVNIQTEIFLKTMNYLEPLCPAPIYGEIKSETDAIELFDKMLYKTDDDGVIDILYTFQYEVGIPSRSNDKKMSSIGILGMELADDYITLNSLYNNPRFTKKDVIRFENMARLQLLKLAIDTGYNQNDFHAGNILVDPTYSGYYDKLKGKIMLIDFGRASKIQPGYLKQIKEYVSNRNYKDALLLLYKSSQFKSFRLYTYPNYYGWIADVYNNNTPNVPNEENVYVQTKEQEVENQTQTAEELNAALYNLDTLIEKSIDKRVNQFLNRKHKIYLPLSNAIKKTLFSGMISDDKILSEPSRSPSPPPLQLPSHFGEPASSHLPRTPRLPQPLYLPITPPSPPSF